MNNILIFESLTFLMLLPVYKWWWDGFAKKPSDSHEHDTALYTLLPVLSVPPSIVVGLMGIIIAASEDKPTVAYDMYIPIFWLLYFGPFAFLLAILRAVGFGNTSIGKKMGFYPPSAQMYGTRYDGYYTK